MNETIILLSIPLFFASIAIEWLVFRARRRDAYDLADTVADLGGGIGQQLFDPLARLLQLALYGFVFEHAIRGPLPATPLTWVLAFVGVDFFYYWFHRASHRIGVFWAVHEVHHQSPRYNLAVALRQSWLEKFTDVFFYLPLAWLGVPVWMYLVSFSLNLVYQFFLHTQLVRRLGPLEIVFNTPSHHRVHHGINPRYIDKNYAGIFIVWDRLFGTFEPEREEPVYGLVESFVSADALRANVVGWKKLAEHSAAATTIGEKIWAFFAPPEWRPRALGGDVTVPEPDPARRARAPRIEMSRGRTAYVAVQFAVLSLGTPAIIAAEPHLSAAAYAAGAVLMVAGLVGIAAVAEGKRWARGFEASRLLLTAAFLVAVAVRFAPHLST